MDINNISLVDWINHYTHKYKGLSEKKILRRSCLDLSYLNLKEIHPKLKDYKGGKYRGETEGALYLNNNLIEEIPEDFVQHNNVIIYLQNNKIKKIPDGFHSPDYLNLNNNDITEIPKEFSPKGLFQVCNNPIEKIWNPELLEPSCLESLLSRNSDLIERRKTKDRFLMDCED